MHRQSSPASPPFSTHCTLLGQGNSWPRDLSSAPTKLNKPLLLKKTKQNQHVTRTKGCPLWWSPSCFYNCNCRMQSPSTQLLPHMFCHFHCRQQSQCAPVNTRAPASLHTGPEAPVKPLYLLPITKSAFPAGSKRPQRKALGGNAGGQRL